jgi:hypothetical protein
MPCERCSSSSLSSSWEQTATALYVELPYLLAYKTPLCGPCETNALSQGGLIAEGFAGRALIGYIRVTVEAVAVLSWLAGFIAVAVQTSTDTCSAGKYSCELLKAPTVFGAFEWLLFMVSAALAVGYDYIVETETGFAPYCTVACTAGFPCPEFFLWRYALSQDCRSPPIDFGDNPRFRGPTLVHLWVSQYHADFDY